MIGGLMDFPTKIPEVIHQYLELGKTRRLFACADAIQDSLKT
jgi:hypothetical protein